MELKQLLKSSYSNQQKDYDDYFEIKQNLRDKDISAINERYYVNDNDKKVYAIHRGTKNLNNDLLADLDTIIGTKFSNRWDDSKKIYEKAKNKYPDYNFYHIGHSLGAQIADYLTKDNPEDKVYNYGKWSSPINLLKDNNNPNHHNYRNNLDLFSIFSIKESKNANGDSNVFTAHNIDEFKKEIKI